MCLRSAAGFPDALVVDHDAKFTSEVFRAFVKSMGSCLIVGSAYRKNTIAKVERVKGSISDTLPPTPAAATPQERLGQSSHARRVRHQQHHIDVRQ